MNSLFTVAAGITSVLGLAAFLAALYFSYQVRKLKHDEQQLKTAPPDSRGPLLDQWLTRYGLDGQGLTKEQRFVLIQRELELRFAAQQTKQRQAFIVTLCLVLVVGGLLGYGMRMPVDPPVDPRKPAETPSPQASSKGAQVISVGNIDNANVNAKQTAHSATDQQINTGDIKASSVNLTQEQKP